MPEMELEIIREIDRPELIRILQKPVITVVEKQLQMGAPPRLNIVKSAVNLQSELDLKNASIGIADGEMLPMVNIAAVYPYYAIRQDIEGWCVVHFTVSATGGVVKETIELIDSEPPGIFDTSCRETVMGFKFKPRIVNGKGVAVPHVRYIFKFQLEDDPPKKQRYRH